MSRKTRWLTVLAAVALASSSSTLAGAQSLSVSGTIADSDSIFVDGKSFQVITGKAKRDVAAQIEALGARDLGLGAVIFRSGEKLYIIDAPLLLSTNGAPDRQSIYVDADRARTNRIRIEYEPPKDPAHQAIYELLKERQVLETLQRMFAPFRFPTDLTIKTLSCNGMVNSWYNTDSSGPTVHMCYELLQDILKNMPEETSPTGITPHDAVVGQFLFWVLHELGHATFDLLQVPLFGREEDAADLFAGYILLQFGKEQAHRWVEGAAYAAHEFMKNYKQNPTVQRSLQAYSSVHGLPEQRYYNFLCLAYGADPVLFADVMENEYLPKRRADNCKYEYATFAYAFHRQISPHIDQQMARAVLDATWFPESSCGGTHCLSPARPPPRNP
jgi:hypothetical protein